MRRRLAWKMSVVAALVTGLVAGLAACARREGGPAPAAPPAARLASAAVAPSVAPVASAPVTSAPVAPASAAPAATSSSAPPPVPKDSFEQGVAQIRNRVPEWDNGTGIAIRFVQVQTGKRLTFLYVDKTAPEWKEKLKTWLILSKATWDGEIVSTVAITLSALKAGRFEGAPSKTECMIGAAIGTDRWDPKDPSSAWSNNEGGFCEVELREGSRPGHLEGKFKAKLVSSEGVYYTVDEGYLYINR